MSDNNTNTKQRPLLLFKHNPKAGGGSIIDVLKEIKPEILTIEIEEMEEMDTKKFEDINTNESYIHRLEFDEVNHQDQEKTFVISNIREPCSHYLSLWAFGSKGRGWLFEHLTETKGEAWIEKAYGKDGPHFHSDQDIASFQNVWLKDTSVRSYIADRFKVLYSMNDMEDEEETSPSNTNVEIESTPVDCWVFLENFQESLVSCLQKFENQGGFIDWNTSILSKMVKKLNENQNRRRLKQSYNKNDPLGNPQRNHHSKCSKYFANSTASFIENGPESFIYDTFGYQGCCGGTSFTSFYNDSQQWKEEGEQQQQGPSSISPTVLGNVIKTNLRQGINEPQTDNRGDIIFSDTTSENDNSMEASLSTSFVMVPFILSLLALITLKVLYHRIINRRGK